MGSVELAVGHGVRVSWDSEPGTSRGTRVGTAAIPQFEVGRTEAPTEARNPHLSDLVTDMQEVASLLGQP